MTNTIKTKYVGTIKNWSNKYGGDEREITVKKIISNNYNTTSKDLDLRNDITNHSPDGAYWGYGGSGPSQLALGIIADTLQDMGVKNIKDQVYKYYQNFKWDVIAKFPIDQGWELDQSQVTEYIRTKDIEKNQ